MLFNPDPIDHPFAIGGESTVPRLAYMRQIGQRLKEARIAQGLTIAMVSSNYKIPDTLIEGIEDGKKCGSFWAIVCIARCLNLSLDQLVEGIEP